MQDSPLVVLLQAIITKSKTFNLVHSYNKCRWYHIQVVEYEERT